MRIKIVILCGLLSCSTLELLGQTEIKAPSKKELANDSVKSAMIQLLITSLNSLNKNSEKMSADVSTLSNSLKNVEITTKTSNDQLTNLLNNTKLEAKDKYSVAKSNVIQSAIAFEQAIKVIENLDRGIDSQIKNATDNKLSNPESGVLGFKLSEKIEELARGILFKKESKLASFMATVKSISNSDLVTKITPAPALGIANSIINLLHGISMNSKELDTKKIDSFEKEFAPYVLYFQKSGIADDESISSNKLLKSQLDLVTKDVVKTLTSVLESNNLRKELKITHKVKADSESDLDYLKERVKAYSSLSVNNYFNELEKAKDYLTKEGQVDHQKILNEKIFLKEVNNKLGPFTEYFTLLNFIEKEYIKSLTSYDDGKIAAIEIAPKDKRNEDTIVKLIESTKKASVIFIEKEKKTVSTKDLKSSIDKAKFDIKIL